ncbi:hypothetical protein B1H18_25105 [Streptomyces tsukubensis]|uniref:Lipoprotein n=2 Tax=Streptomyces tsukubensis TaxID=83656 RepID=A0A1V4A421_9ACTN|nr:hypothetical protein B1H18_25105 [Streptomyces tsukubensis]
MSRAAAVPATLALAATACGETSDESAEKGDSDSSATSGYHGKGVGLAYDIGGKGDQSFNDAAFHEVARRGGEGAVAGWGRRHGGVGTAARRGGGRGGVKRPRRATRATGCARPVTVSGTAR